MQINQLQQIAAIERYKSINKAAQALNISQPALSATLRDLEKELGVLLFERTSKGVTITSDGAEIIQEVNQILESIDRINHVTGNVNSQTEIKIFFGIFFEHLIPDIVRAFQKKWPLICLNFSQLDNVNQTIDHIAKKHYRVCITCFIEEELEQIKELPFVHVDVIANDIGTGVFINKKHPFATKEKIFIESLQTEQIILTHSNSEFYYFYENQFPDLSNACKIVMPNFFSALYLLKNSSGVILHPVSKSQENSYLKLFPDIVEIPIDDHSETLLHAAVISPKSHMLSKPEIDLLEIIKEIMSNDKK